MLNQNNFTIVDVETTGGNQYFDRVMEIGLIRVEDGKVVEAYQQLFNPGTAIPEFITKMTGISDDDVVDAPEFSELAKEIHAKFGDAVFVAHNSQFDYGFIQEEFRRAGIAFEAPQLCTVKLSRLLFPEHKRHNLTELISRYGFECNNRHRAFDDARVLWDFLLHLQGSLPPEQLTAAYKKLLKKPKGFSDTKTGEQNNPQLSQFPA